VGNKPGPKSKHKTDKIDPIEVEKLAAMQCTMEEMAHFFDCSVDLLEMNFSDVIKKGRSKGKMSMKRALFEKVQKGDLGAIVWFGKNFAGMSDKIEQKVKSDVMLHDEQSKTLEHLKKLAKQGRLKIEPPSTDS